MSLPLDPDGHLYVFGYGSLMWRPGFPHAQAHPALLRGFHRRFCLWSRHYRGTPETPGLVLGLDRGGACRGLAFRVAATDAPAVLDYLEERENPTGESVYHRRLLPVHLLDGGRRALAVAYVADPACRAFCRPCEATAAQVIARARGKTGPNREYLLNTLRHLEALGVRDSRLARIAALMEGAPA
ncbi:MAG: gamma-glutamylcyclotransferase [Acetobacteraceae bacterium]|nr:gamma-glutamylcyclotransferase [Acetobacteraceae bacterium]